VERVGTTAEALTFPGEEALWASLVLLLSIPSNHVQSALSDRHGKASAEIASLSIPDEDLHPLKLACHEVPHLFRHGHSPHKSPQHQESRRFAHGTMDECRFN